MSNRKVTGRRIGLFTFALFAAVGVHAGCREILSIEEKEFDPSLADGGTDGATDPLSCAAYCDTIEALCTGNRRQFASRDACIGLCSTYPKGTLEDETGNTLGCRIRMLEAGDAIETSECLAAGPGGDDQCGSNCKSFCASIVTVCPGSFESTGDCETECAEWIKCGDYYVDPSVTPDNPSIQCRLYHMSAAAIGILEKEDGMSTPAQDKHCPHAEGITECIVDSGISCP